MECPSCHTIAEEASARFCTACGTALTDAERSTEHSFVDDRGDAVGEDLADDATGELARLNDGFADDLETRLALQRRDHEAAHDPASSVGWGDTTTGIDGAPQWGDDRPFDDTIDDLPVDGITLAGLVADTIADEPVEHDPASVDDTGDISGDVHGAPPHDPPDVTLTRPDVRPVSERRRALPSATAGAVAAVAVVVAIAIDVVSVASTATGDALRTAVAAGYRSGVWHAGDLSGGTTVAALVCAAGLAAGATGSVLGLRWAPGLVAGSALSATGLCTLLVALAEEPLAIAQDVALLSTSEAPFSVTVTRDIGWWALLIAAGAGLVAFFGSLDDVGADTRNDLNPLVAALGAFAALAGAAGPTLAVGSASWLDNITVDAAATGWPLVMVLARAAHLVAFAVCGVAGFLMVRRSGLAMVTASLIPTMILLISAWVDMGTAPIGPGLANPGTTPTDVHPVTLIAVVSCAAMAAVAGAIAFDHTDRRRAAGLITPPG